MRDKVRALYYPDSWSEAPTLKKSILLFDEIHFMDRPSFTLLADSRDGQGTVGMLGMQSPLRQYERSFREEGVPLYVHAAPGGPLTGDLLQSVKADVSDSAYMRQFQEGLRDSPHFRNLHISPGNYGAGETHESIFQKLAAIDLKQSPPSLELLQNSRVRHFDHATPEGCHKVLATAAAFCSAKMNFALEAGVREGFSPLADMSPYANLLSAKYGRAATRNEIIATDLSVAILDELVPAEVLTKITIPDAIKYRKESEPARHAFLEHLLALHAKLGQIPENGDYAAMIRKIITTEVRPAAREFQAKLATISEKLFGKIAGTAVVAAGSPALIQVFGDITLEKLASIGASAAFYVAKEVIDAVVESREVRRECAFSYLLDIEK